MFTYRKKTAGAALAAVLLVGGATACESGKKNDGGKAAAPASSAPAAKTAQVTPVALLEKSQKAAEEITSLRYAMSGTSPDGTFTGDIAMTLKPAVAASMKIGSADKPGETAEIRLLDGAMYMGSEGKWLKFDVKAMDPAAAAKLDSAGKGTKSAENPGDKVAELLQSKDVKLVGEETVEGRKTQHLSGTLTLDQLKAAAATGDQAAKERREKSVRELEKQGATGMTLDLWIGEDNRLYQMRSQAQGGKGRTDVTIKVTEYNKPVEVAAPPADQTLDLAEMMKGAGEGAA